MFILKPKYSLIIEYGVIRSINIKMILIVTHYPTLNNLQPYFQFHQEFIITQSFQSFPIFFHQKERSKN